MTEANDAALAEIFKRADVRVNGKPKVSLIAKLAGLTDQQVYAFLRRHPYWRAQVAEVNPDNVAPKEPDLIDPVVPPPTTGITITPDEFAKMQALLRQQKKMQAKEWHELGMDEGMAQRAETLNKLGAAPLIHVTQTLYGGLIKDTMILDRQLEADAERIRANSLPGEFDRDGEPVEDGKKQRDWRYCYYAGVKLRLEIYNSILKTQGMLARLMAEMNRAGLGAKPGEKGVFEVQISERRPDDHAA